MGAVTQAVSVEPATYAAGLRIATFVGDVKAAVKSGSVVSEIIGIATAAIGDLVPLLSEIPTLKLEASDDLFAELNTLALTGVAIAKALVS